MAGREATPQLLELVLGRHLLGHQGRLDAVKETLEPADELGLCDPQFGVARGALAAERQGQTIEFGH